MNAFDLNQLIAQVAKEKGITQEKLQEALENAMLKAAKKVFGTNKAIESIYEDEIGEIKLFHVIKIVGDEDEPLTEADFEELEEDDSEEAHLLRREDRDSSIRQLTSSYEENQLHVETAKREYALDLKVGQFIRLPVLYQSELLERQIAAFKAERRSRRGSDREELDRQIRQLELRLSKELDEIKRYSERFGDLLLVDKEGRGFGRIAAQAAKGVIQDKIRQAERDKIFEDFNGREEIEIGVIRRFERGGGITVALTTPDQEQTVEALLPRREQIPHESYRPGQSIKCVIKSVHRDTKSAQIILSQRHENFIKKLFEQAVPEIYHGIVEVKGVARLFGESRGVKVAVNSKDPNVDAAGACIGPNGSRVKLVEAEIGGDKIEIVPYSSQAHIYVCNALQPAEVSRLLIDHDGNKMDVIVPDHQLSKAIGKRGKNVRLASLLTGWSLDIYSENKMKERESRIFELLSSQEGVRVEDLEMVWEKTNLRSLDQIAFAELEDLGNIPASSAEGIIEAANLLLSRRDAGEDIYHQTLQDFRERAWASWPRADEILTRELFERCHNIGIGMLSKLAAVEPEVLSDRLRIDEAVATEIYQAANQHLSS